MKASRTILALSGASPLASVASPAPARAQDDNFEGSAFDASNDSSTGDASPGDEARRSPMSPRDIPARYVVRRGDTLWDVTGRFFGDPFLWPRIWSYNPDITNPHWIYPEGQLRLVPEPGTPQAAAAAAQRADERPGHLLLIDELNRANVPRVFGEPKVRSHAGLPRLAGRRAGLGGSA